MNTIKFTCTALPVNKQGKLPCDEFGYYTVILGGLNMVNSANQYYSYEKSAIELFKSSSSFMRRVKDGKLYGEVGHPKRLPGMTDDDYVDRILNVWEDNWSHHISDVWLDLDYGKNHPEYNNPLMIAIMGKVKPFGKYGHILKESLENPKQNTSFSIRSFTDNAFNGQYLKKVLVKIETFDFVGEQGIFIADKYTSPSLECFYEKTLTSFDLERIVKRDAIVSNESSKQLVTEVLNYIKPIKNNYSHIVNW